MKSKQLKKVGFAPLLIFFVPFLITIYCSGSIGLFETSEGRYASVAQAMVDTGDWLIPYHNGLKHLTKPPVTYWITAIGIELFGSNEFGARFFLSISAGFIALGCYFIGRLLFTKFIGYLSALILSTSIFYIAQVRGLTTDPYLTMFETFMVLGFIAFLKKPSMRWNLLFWTMASLAMLTKGPPGLLPLLGLIPAALYISKKEKLKILFKSKIGIGIFLIIGMGWYFIVAFKIPGLMSYFLVDETIKRVASSSHHRTGPFYMFILLLPVGLFPWTPFLFSGIKKLWQSAKQKKTECILLFWLFIPLIVFSISKSKLPAYVLPLMLPIAIIAAYSLENILKNFRKRNRPQKIHFIFILAVFAISGIGLFYYAIFKNIPDIFLARNALFLAFFWCFIAISSSVFYYFKQKKMLIASIALFAPGLILFLLPGLRGNEEFKPEKYLPSQAAMLEQIAKLPKDQEVLCIEEMIEGYYFYTKRPLRTWNVSRITKFDKENGKKLVLMGDKQLKDCVNQNTLLLIRKKDITKVETILKKSIKILYDKDKWFIARIRR